MKTIRVTASYGWSGCEDEDEFEVEDDATEDDIEKIAWEYGQAMAQDRLDVSWEEVEE